MYKTSLTVLAAVALSGCIITPQSNTVNSDFAKTQQYYQQLVDADAPNVAGLNQFFTQMPKGGDIHHHYSGSVYAETYLEWLAKKEWSINTCTLKVVKQSSPSSPQTGLCQLKSSQALFADSALLGQVLQAWSDKDYANHTHQTIAPDAQFFNTFGYFGIIAHEYTELGLATLKKRAQAENVTYIETMLSTVGVQIPQSFPVDNFTTQLRTAQDDTALFATFDKLAQALEQNTDLTSKVDSFTQNVARFQNTFDDEHFTMRYQTYGVRVMNPVHVFSDLLSGFIAAEQSPYVVGVNIVSPENNPVSLSDYSLHMKMFAYLHAKYPSVNRALHAGELTLGMVRPKDLQFHINEALNVAKAQRIGHGVDIVYEQNSPQLLKQLKERAAIEINLTSNEFILGVEGQAHPYTVYARYGVPMVISTDDSGVSRNNLSNEYVLLASRYQPSYSTIKEYVYNSIRYSFMSEQDKARNVALLDARFARFERQIADYVANMK